MVKTLQKPKIIDLNSPQQNGTSKRDALSGELGKMYKKVWDEKKEETDPDPLFKSSEVPGIMEPKAINVTITIKGQRYAFDYDELRLPIHQTFLGLFTTLIAEKTNDLRKSGIAVDKDTVILSEKDANKYSQKLIRQSIMEYISECTGIPEDDLKIEPDEYQFIYLLIMNDPGIQRANRMLGEHAKSVVLLSTLYNQ